MISEKDIAEAKKRVSYSLSEAPLHEHDDCIRMAYEWLDAQVKTKRHTRYCRPIKHIIERWAGRYISTSDVDVAAELHPDIRGTYPYFNISSRLTKPSTDRLKGIGEAFTQGYHKGPSNHEPYKVTEACAA